MSNLFAPLSMPVSLMKSPDIVILIEVGVYEIPYGSTGIVDVFEDKSKFIESDVESALFNTRVSSENAPYVSKNAD